MLSEVVGELVKKQNISYYKLAKEMGVGYGVIDHVKRGHIKKPSFELICKLADVFELSLDEFRKELEKVGDDNATTASGSDDSNS